MKKKFPIESMIITIGHVHKSKTLGYYWITTTTNLGFCFDGTYGILPEVGQTMELLFTRSKVYSSDDKVATIEAIRYGGVQYVPYHTGNLRISTNLIRDVWKEAYAMKEASL